MATIDDFGGTADPLSAPALGGPTGWAAAVRDAIVALQTAAPPQGDLPADGLTIQATGATTWESESTARARYGITSWSGRRRWVSTDYPGHTAPPNPAVGDLWDQAPA